MSKLLDEKTVIDNIEYRNRNNLSCSSFECFKQTIDFKTVFEAVSTYAKAYKELGYNFKLVKDHVTIYF